MSTVVYQNLHHCYDSNNFVESRQLSLKLNAPKSQTFANSYVEENEPCSKNSYSNMFGWSGIETPSKQEEPVYIHPLVKNSASKLSQKSLEMCTESLGCETGTCIIDNSVFFQSTMAKDVRNTRPKFETKKETTHVKLPLPPPLTTITGPNSIRVEPVRENGRLVIKAVSTPTKQPCLQAERSNGRLRLSLVRDYSSDDDCETSDYNEPEVCINNNNNNKNDDDSDNDNNEERTMVGVSMKQTEVKVSEDDVSLGENMEEVKIMLGVKVEIVKMQIPSRCKERGQGNKRLVNWELFWVAT